MPSFDPGEVHFWIKQRWVLPLRVSALTPKRGEVGDASGGQTACYRGIGGKAGNGDRVIPYGKGILAGLGLGEADAGVDDLVRPPQVRVAERDLLVEKAYSTVGLPVEWEQDGGIVDPGLFAVADADEPGIACVLLIVEAEVALIRVISKGDQLRVVVGGQASG